MPAEAPNILKAKFLIPSNLGGGPFFGFGLLVQHSSKHFLDVRLVLFFIFVVAFGKVFGKVFGKRGRKFWRKGGKT